jgi:hypothetical protein
MQANSANEMHPNSQTPSAIHAPQADMHFAVRPSIIHTQSASHAPQWTQSASHAPQWTQSASHAPQRDNLHETETIPEAILKESVTAKTSRQSALSKHTGTSSPAKRVQWDMESNSIENIPGYTRLHILYLYCGDPHRSNGVPELLRARGCMITARDILGGCDLLNDTEWCKIEKGVRTMYDFVLMSPPCVTFAPSRGKGPGPRVLRSHDEIYGMKSLSPPLTSLETAAIKNGNFHNAQCLKLGAICHREGVGFAIECPAIMFDYQVSMLHFREAKILDAMSGVENVIGDQCMLGSKTKKPTNYKVYTNGDIKVWRHTLEKTCDHADQLWTWSDASGNEWKSWSPHPKLVGVHTPDGKWATTAAATYPELLNKALVNLMLGSGSADRRQGTMAS